MTKQNTKNQGNDNFTKTGLPGEVGISKDRLSYFIKMFQLFMIFASH